MSLYIPIANMFMRENDLITLRKQIVKLMLLSSFRIRMIWPPFLLIKYILFQKTKSQPCLKNRFDLQTEYLFLLNLEQTECISPLFKTILCQI